MINFLTFDTIHLKYRLLQFLLHIENPRSRDVQNLVEVSQQLGLGRRKPAQVSGLCDLCMSPVWLQISHAKGGVVPFLPRLSALWPGMSVKALVEGDCSDAFHSICPRSLAVLEACIE